MATNIVNIGNKMNGNNPLMRECQFIGRFNDLTRAPSLERENGSFWINNRLKRTQTSLN